MNLYFLVEGRRTERKVYPAWLAHLLPHFTRVEQFDAVRDKHYFLVSGEGYPSLLDDHLRDAIDNCNRVGRYSHLVLCMDADESTAGDRVREVRDRVAAKRWELNGTALEIVVQNRTIETWFLGNSRIVSRSPQRSRLRQFVGFYDVTQFDPELMGRYPGYTTHAQFHGEYLREVFQERGIVYSKRSPGHVTESSYLGQLLNRVEREPTHLATFRTFVDFCRHVAAVTGGPAEPFRQSSC